MACGTAARLIGALVLFAMACPRLLAGETGQFEFTRMVAHWAGYADPDYLAFVDEAQPELVQHGFYGAHFWGLAHTPQYSGYPAHLPVRGLEECRAWFAERNGELRRRGAKVVGHFNVEFLVGDPDGPDGPRGFFKFYRDLWDEELLGPRPAADPMSLLERNADGTPISQKGYGIGGMHEYWGCLRNPGWQEVLKAWVRAGIRAGLDGFVINYFYRHNCLCMHCRAAFNAYLADRFTGEELRDKFRIDDLAGHQFDEILCWHDPAETSPLRLEMLRFSQLSNKQVFDEVFVKYGRSLKPDLIVAQWNHLGRFSQIGGDERCLLPAEKWASEETYLWYSTGGSAHYTDLQERYLGDGTLQARFIRGASGDKPFTLGKYESTRIRVAIAELAANGGAPMGFYTRFSDPEARREIVRYYGFMQRYDELYRANRSHAEALLLFPRNSVHGGDVEPVTRFRELGRELLERHVLFDVLPDDLAGPELRARYRRVFTAEDPGPGVDGLVPAGLSRFEAPFTVQVSASRPADGNEITLHFVNYNREEPPRGQDGKPSGGRGIGDENPIAVSGVSAELVVPEGLRAARVEVLTPEAPDMRRLEMTLVDERVCFDVPEFLVYAVVRVRPALGE